MKLTPAQQHAKDALRAARAAQKTARSRFEAEMEIAWRERSASVTQSVLDAVREAVRVGVPKTQIGQAYGSKDYNTIKALIESVKMTTAQADAIAVQVIYDLNYPDSFVVNLKNFDDWTDPANTGPLTGTVPYQRDSALGDWFTDDRTDVARAVERELWHTSPLRTEVAKVVPLDTEPDVEQDEEDEVDPQWFEDGLNGPGDSPYDW